MSVLRIADMLSAEIESAEISKNDVIRKTGIDRSTFYQILGNRRMATPAQFLEILDALQPDATNRLLLLRQYERERIGEDKFAKYEKVRTFLRMLSVEDKDGEENSIEAKCPEKIEALIRHALQRNGQIKIRLLLPTELFFSLGLEKVLEENTHKGSNVCVEQMLIDWDGNSDADPMIRGFAGYLKLLERNPDFCVNACMSDNVIFHAEGTPYPFYMIDEDAMVMFDHTGMNCICVQDQVLIREYTKHFDHLIRNAKPVVTLNRNMAELYQHMTAAVMDEAGHQDQRRNKVSGKIFLLSETPCVWLSTTMEQNKIYFDSEDGLAYGAMLRSLDIIEFSSMERLNRFFDGQRITESGVNMKIRKEHMSILRNSIMSRIGKNLFLLNEEVQPLPNGYVLYLAGNGRMVLTPYKDSRFLVCVQNWNFAKEVYEWFETRVSTVNPEC